MEEAGLSDQVEIRLQDYRDLAGEQFDAISSNWDECVRLVGVGRARVWQLYMAASAVGFEDGGLALHQVLCVVPVSDGGSGMPPTRNGWTTPQLPNLIAYRKDG